MKLSAYIILIIWATALGAALYFMYDISRGARAELGTLWNTTPASAPAPLAIQETLVRRTVSASKDVRSELSTGLAALTAALKDYQARLAHSAGTPSAQASTQN